MFQLLPASAVLRIVPAPPTATQWLASAQLMSTRLAEIALSWSIQRPDGGAEVAVGEGVASADGAGSKGITSVCWGLSGAGLNGQRGASERTALVTATRVTIATNNEGICQRMACRLRSCPA